jgi:hypothetical protein
MHPIKKLFRHIRVVGALLNCKRIKHHEDGFNCRGSDAGWIIWYLLCGSKKWRLGNGARDPNEQHDRYIPRRFGILTGRPDEGQDDNWKRQRRL